jgi:hypothetical protein
MFSEYLPNNFFGYDNFIFFGLLLFLKVYNKKKFQSNWHNLCFFFIFKITLEKDSKIQNA